MLMIYVIAGVIGFIIYTLIKTKIEEWFEEPRMNKLSLKRRRTSNGGSESENRSPTSTVNIIEISSDESDTMLFQNISNDDEGLPAAEELPKHYDEETLPKFQKSTDAIESNDDIAGPTFIRRSQPTTSMFSWTYKNSKLKQNELHDSDSSDDSFYESRWFYHKEEKKLKTFEAAEVANKAEPEEDALPEVAIHHEQLISGIRVKLPVKPYSCQIAVMNKLIQGCVKKENCLLESPTGSGKTLALLCAVLAWHDQHCAEVERERKSNAAGGDYMSYDSDDDNAASFSKHTGKKCGDEFDCGDEFKKYVNILGDEIPQLKVAKIYYGTRTHKQIEQVVRELRKTSYRHKKMTILSSREHTCIQDSTRNKTELCNDLLDPVKHRGCPYYNERNKKSISNFPSVESRGLEPVWDIEDLVAIGKKQELCPYFAARNLMEHADIIFCPYNYIIDPDIRESMQLNLKDQVIILDEAHNIEDICRDVASVNFREDHLTAAASECESLTKQRASDFPTYNTLNQYILQLVKFIKAITLLKPDYNSDNLSSPYWNGAELLELFNMHGLGESTYSNFLAASYAAIQDCEKAKEENRIFQKTVKPIISPSTKIIIEHLVFAMRMITSEQFRNDYRGCITETYVKDFKYAQEDTWYSAKRQEHRARTLKLICMNPGVTFSPLAQSARCIILASGTLTPTASFQSELSTKFAHVLNTAHVIPKEQVYATCVPKGPNGVHLKANYQNVNSWDFQDELGRVLLDICESVPHGILCFFSSYNVMHTQMERWKNNSTWSKITNIKRVFIEPRYGGDLNNIMSEYREVIQDTSDEQRGKINGALFLAVFRGKVAEGIDFRDNEARCVVTVGIPYAVRKDPVIDMKLKYNDMNTARGLLRGSDWYSIQAFRALNQALGRCLRHINDWGAVLLVDERFLVSENKENLPKWVKTMWITQNGYKLRQNLATFVARQKAKENKK